MTHRVQFETSRQCLHRRAGAAVLASVTTVVLFVAVVAVFGHASSTPWLPDTPEARRVVAGCDRSVERAARDLCVDVARAHWEAQRHGGQQQIAAR